MILVSILGFRGRGIEWRDFEKCREQQGSGNPVKKGAKRAFLALFSSFNRFLPLHDLGKML